MIMNKPVLVDVAAGDVVVGHARLDMLPVASDAAASVQARLALEQAVVDRPLVKNANVTVSVTLTQDVPPSSNHGSQQGQDIPDGEHQEAQTTSRTPFHFADVNTVAESSVLSLGPAKAVDLPESFIAAAQAAPSGIGAQMALMWKSSSGWTGITSALGVSSGSTLSWNDSWRTFISPTDFSAMRGVLENGGNIYIEVARSVS
jgi:hypothetical protein